MSDIHNPTNQTYDAQQLIEVYEASEEVNPPEVNIDADYEAAQKYSTGVDAETAAEMTAPMLEVPAPEPIHLDANSTGSPADFKSMAHDLTANRGSATVTVNDDLVHRALEKGTPAE